MVKGSIMPRRLKVYQTSQGFYDLVIAAPSMKAALEAWGSNMNLFHQGFASEADDSDVVAAAMNKPGVVLRRPVGSNKPFSEHADLPTAASFAGPVSKRKPQDKKARAALKVRKADPHADRRAAAAFEKEQLLRERKREKEEAAAVKAREKRLAAINAAEAEIADATREHERIASEIEKELASVQRRSDEEERRWEKQKEQLRKELSKARR